MPKYAYGCPVCGTVEEIIHSMFDEGPFECDVCGSEKQKIYTPTSIQFKGEGFYSNDKNGPFIWGDSRG